MVGLAAVWTDQNPRTKPYYLAESCFLAKLQQMGTWGASYCLPQVWNFPDFSLKFHHENNTNFLSKICSEFSWLRVYYRFFEIFRIFSVKFPLTRCRWGGLGNHRYPIGFSGDVYPSWASLEFQPYFTSTANNLGCVYNSRIFLEFSTDSPRNFREKSDSL